MKKILERVIGELVDNKAEADVILNSSRSLQLSSQNCALSVYKISSSQMMGVRVIKDSKIGIAYTESFDEESLKFMITRALQNAEINEPNHNESILEISGELLDLKEYPEENVDISLKTQRAIELESKVRKLDPRVVGVPHNSYSESEFQSHYLSSRGRSTVFSDKSYSISTSALMEEKGRKSNFYDFHRAHRFADLQWDKVVTTSLQHARNLLDEKTLPSGKYSVRFDVDCLKDLIECFSNFYSAKSAVDKVNPWGAKLGTQVISSDLTIEDHPTPAGAFRASAFDSEGHPQVPLKLIENGELKNLLHNSATARSLNAKSTGHASRGPTSSLNVSGTHFLIKGKNSRPLPANYLEIIQMDGLYSGANRVSGTFSVGVKGYLWENGQRTSTFGNITLSGNLVELLNHVEVAGDLLEVSTDQTFFSVPLVFAALSIAGA
ncbi:MAG TPA: TldD/PmbA family protein [Bacteriovoracaceae bacterium]|nr:TldD/PmbA family protein [Bacteriovoracaceae bacterium]